jgi:phospholipid/cholesterol/gamma-HCH transport system substrate-binding protein
VKPVGIFGDAAIALTPTGPSPVSYRPGDTVPVGPSDTDIQAIMNRVDSIGATVQTMTNFRTSSASLTRIAANLDSTSRHANSLLAGLERGDGTAGKLMRDSLLYTDLRHVVQHVDSVLADFKANPKKYIKVSVF